MQDSDQYEIIVDLLDDISSKKAVLASLELGEINAINIFSKAKDIAPALLALAESVDAGLQFLLEEKLSEVAPSGETDSKD